MSGTRAGKKEEPGEGRQDVEGSSQNGKGALSSAKMNDKFWLRSGRRGRMEENKGGVKERRDRKEQANQPARGFCLPLLK